MTEQKKVRRKESTGSGEPVKPRKRGKAALVSRVLRKMQKKLASDDLKPTVGDFIRLLQLEKELEDEQPREIKVSWVDPEQKNENNNADGK